MRQSGFFYCKKAKILRGSFFDTLYIGVHLSVSKSLFLIEKRRFTEGYKMDKRLQLFKWV